MLTLSWNVRAYTYTCVIDRFECLVTYKVDPLGGTTFTWLVKDNEFFLEQNWTTSLEEALLACKLVVTKELGFAEGDAIPKVTRVPRLNFDPLCPTYSVPCEYMSIALAATTAKTNNTSLKTITVEQAATNDAVFALLLAILVRSHGEYNDVLAPFANIPICKGARVETLKAGD